MEWIDGYNPFLWLAFREAFEPALFVEVGCTIDVLAGINK